MRSITRESPLFLRPKPYALALYLSLATPSAAGPSDPQEPSVDLPRVAPEGFAWVAARDLEPGEFIEPNDVMLWKIPENDATRAMIGDLYRDRRELDRLMATHYVFRGQPVRTQRFRKMTNLDWADTIPHDQRAIDVPLGALVAEELRTGDRVNLLLTEPDAPSTPSCAALTDVRVERLSRPSDAPATATVFVPMATALSLAASGASKLFVLRPSADPREDESPTPCARPDEAKP